MKQMLLGNKSALDNIRNLVMRMKKTGRTNISMTDIMLRFKYSPYEIEHVMKALEREGLVREE